MTLILDTVGSHLGVSKTRSDGFLKVFPYHYRYEKTGKYFAFIRYQGKLTKQKLEANTLAHAKRELIEARQKLERIDLKAGEFTLTIPVTASDTSTRSWGTPLWGDCPWMRFASSEFYGPAPRHAPPREDGGEFVEEGNALVDDVKEDNAGVRRFRPGDEEER